MIVFNYTKIKRREKRLYAILNTTVSRSGIVVKTIQTCGIVLGIFSIFGLVFCGITGTFWYNPIGLASGTGTGYFYLVFVLAPIAIGVILNQAKIQNYKLVDYLRIYFTPKVALDQDGKKIKLTKYKVDSFIEKL